MEGVNTQVPDSVRLIAVMVLATPNQNNQFVTAIAYHAAMSPNLLGPV